MRTVKVGRANVPVVGDEFFSIVSFKSGDKGTREAGDYAFWTAVLKKPSKDMKVLIGRARVRLDSGDRFHRMSMEMKKAASESDRKAYGNFWKNLGAGKNIKHIRPSTIDEINRWTVSHDSDAVHITTAIVGGKLFKQKRISILSES